MRLSEQFKTGFQGLGDHPFRTFLTTLGIIFGVAAVIAMVSIGAGAQQEAMEELRRFGTRMIRVEGKPIEGERLKNAVKKLARGLSVDDVDYLKKECPSIEFAAGEQIFKEQLYCLGQKPLATIVGVGDDFLAVSRFEVADGRFIDSFDLKFAKPVVVLGSSIAKEVFGEVNPLDQIVQIGRVRFRVVGVMAEQAKGKGKLAIKSRDHDRDVYLPLNTAKKRLFKWPVEDKDLYHDITGLWLSVKEGIDLLAARDVIMKILKRRHRGVDDVESLVPLEILQQSQKTQELFNWVMAAIAGLSLLVGGIGIMNIMLANVNERTREIGVRRALGASRQDIVVQFLVEAVLISLLGGCLGILVGMGLSHGISFSTGWTTVIPKSTILLAFFISSAVGVVFGSFPAMKASRLDPVTALRYE
ncbi:ABC transporter permease [bacterium]|nr:ABC transporter permease [bacterium]